MRRRNKKWAVILFYIAVLVVLQIVVDCASEEGFEDLIHSITKQAKLDKYSYQVNSNHNNNHNNNLRAAVNERAKKGEGTRTTWRGVSLSDRFCGLDENDECHFVEYGEAMSKLAAPGLVLFVLSIISLIVFCSGRFCCNCFGGRYRSKGWVCGNRDDFEGYTKLEVWIVKILTLCCGIAIALCALLGFLGDKTVTKGLNTMTGTIIDTAGTIVTKASSIGQTLISLPYTVDAGNTVLEFVTTANDTLSKAEEVDDQVKSYNRYRSIALILSFAIPLFLLVIGAIAAIFNLKYFAIIAALLCFICSAIIWLSFGIHKLVSGVFTDLCFEIKEYRSGESSLNSEGGNSSESNAAIDSIIACTNGGSFGDVGQLAEDALNRAYETACAALREICNDTRVNCSESFKGGVGNCTRENLNGFLEATITDYQVGCFDDPFNYICPYDANTMPPCIEVDLCYAVPRTVEQCATSCNNTELRRLANETVYNLGLLFIYTDLLNNEILPLLNCTLIKEAVDTLNDALCVTFAGGISRIAAASGTLGGFLIAATILMIMGFKRFRKNRHSKSSHSNNLDLEDVDQQRSPTSYISPSPHASISPQSSEVSPPAYGESMTVHNNSNHTNEANSADSSSDSEKDSSKSSSKKSSRSNSRSNSNAPPLYPSFPGEVSENTD